jgi:hypothetical protein
MQIHPIATGFGPYSKTSIRTKPQFGSNDTNNGLPPNYDREASRREHMEYIREAFLDGKDMPEDQMALELARRYRHRLHRVFLPANMGIVSPETHEALKNGAPGMNDAELGKTIIDHWDDVLERLDWGIYF